MPIAITSLNNFNVDGTAFTSLASAFAIVASPTLLQNAILTYEAGILLKISQANQRVSDMRTAHTAGNLAAINTLISEMETTENQKRIAALNARIAEAQAEITALS